MTALYHPAQYIRIKDFAFNGFYLLSYFTYLLTDKVNSRMSRATDFISSLINISLSRHVLFYQLQRLQYLHYGIPLYPHSFFATVYRRRFAVNM